MKPSTRTDGRPVEALVSRTVVGGAVSAPSMDTLEVILSAVGSSIDRVLTLLPVA